MSLFDAAVSQVVKDVGGKTLIAVDNRSSADYCKLLSIIERKRYSWHLPWKSSYKYIPTEITLNDLLVEPVDLKNLMTSSVLLENYQNTPSFHKSGKIGAKIADEFDVDVNVNETIEVSLKLGNVMKKEITWQKLYDSISGKKMKVDHPLLKAINKSRKRSLFVIAMVVTAGSELSIDEDTTVGGGLEGKPEVALNLNTSGSSDSKKHRTYSIPLGTCFGYNCYKIKVDESGSVKLQLGEDVVDAEVAEEIIPEENIQPELSELLLESSGKEIITMLRGILKKKPISAFLLNVVVESAVDYLDGEEIKKITVKQLEKMFPEDVVKDCFILLEKTGFKIDGTKDLLYPEDKSKLAFLKSFNLLLDAVAELSQSQIQALAECNISKGQQILYVIRKAIESEVIKEDDGELQGLFHGSNPERTFLKSIGFDLVKSPDSSRARVEFVPPKTELLHVRSTQLAVMGMCSF